jgi:hypothetical protein
MMFAFAVAFPFEVEEFAEKKAWFQATVIALPSTTSPAPDAQPDITKTAETAAATTPEILFSFMFTPLFS